jgi:hypothetical protein
VQVYKDYCRPGQPFWQKSVNLQGRLLLLIVRVGLEKSSQVCTIVYYGNYLSCIKIGYILYHNINLLPVGQDYVARDRGNNGYIISLRE